MDLSTWLLTPTSKCWHYKATLHLLLASMLCFDRERPVASRGSSWASHQARVTQAWEHRWRTMWRSLCLWHNSLQEVVGRRVCCYSTKWSIEATCPTRPRSANHNFYLCFTTCLLECHDPSVLLNYLNKFFYITFYINFFSKQVSQLTIYLSLSLFLSALLAPPTSCLQNQ